MFLVARKGPEDTASGSVTLEGESTGSSFAPGARAFASNWMRGTPEDKEGDRTSPIHARVRQHTQLPVPVRVPDVGRHATAGDRTVADALDLARVHRRTRRRSRNL